MLSSRGETKLPSAGQASLLSLSQFCWDTEAASGVLPGDRLARDMAMVSTARTRGEHSGGHFVP